MKIPQSREAAAGVTTGSGGFLPPLRGSFSLAISAAWDLCPRLPHAAALRLLVLSVLFPSAVFPADWPQWHGPHRNAVSSETGLLKSWEKVVPAFLWRASGAGAGYSSVVIENGLIFTTGRHGSEVRCHCFDAATGQRRWSTPVGSTSRNVMSTPTVHAGLVYTLDPDGELFCLRAADGSVVWQTDFVADFAGRSSGRGFGESPLVDGDRLVCTPGGEDAMLVVFDRLTGDVIWKAAYPDARPTDTAAFSSIVISNGGGIRQYVQLTSRGLVGFEADTGRYLWSYDDISNGRINIPTPIAHGDLIFSANGYHAGSVLLQLTAAENETGIGVREVFRLRGHQFQNHHGGYVRIGQHIYGGHGSNNGLPTCLDLDTGRINWKRRGPGSGSASVIAADGHLYFKYQNGVIALIEASPDEYRPKGSFELPGTGGDSWSHPVIANGRLYLREKDDLWVFDLKRGEAAHNRAAQLAGRDRERLLKFIELPDGVSLTTVVLEQDDIQTDGTIDADFLARLTTSSPIVLHAAGTQLNRTGLRQLAAQPVTFAGINVAFCPQLTDADFAELRDVHQLQLLIASGTAITEAGLGHLTSLPGLRAIDLEFCDGITDAACPVLARMQQLRALNVAKTGFETHRISDDGLAELSRLTQLEFLNLTGNAMRDDGLKHLRSLTRLRDLNLSRVWISDAGLDHLANVSGLRRLVLLFSEGFAGPIVTDAGIETLSSLEHLTDLNLVDSRVTDAAVDELISLQKLSHLTVTGSQISADGISRLRKAKPDCAVIAGAEAFDDERD